MLKRSIVLISTISAALIVSCNSGSTSTAPPPQPSFCQNNVANFTSITGINLATTPFDYTWGPALANLPFPTNLAQCQNSLTWNQQRIAAAISYWVGQKINYCHHHVPTWDPAYTLNGTPNPSADLAYAACSTNSDVMPPVPTESIIRWNYSGIGNESSGIWYESGSHAYATGKYSYGVDCSDYTKLVYAYAESIYFTSDVSMQAGQAANESELAPNMAGFTDSPESDSLGLYSAGNLLCNDGSVAPGRGIANNSSCDSHGGYISVFESNGSYNANDITDSALNNLQLGDLIYIAGCASNPNAKNDISCAYNPRQAVTHVIIWTGQKIGQSSAISPSMIAPETDTDVWGNQHSQCDTGFWSATNNQGNWIISDSHYQGPDYRAFTNCFYRNQVWGIRRVLQNAP